MRLPCFRLTFGFLFSCALLLPGCDGVGGDSGGSEPPLQYVVTGTIVNTTGLPIVGVRVRLTGATGPYEVQQVDGPYSIEDVSEGTYTLTVEATGYTTLTEQIPIASNRAIDRTLLGPGQVTGEVVGSQNGQPVAGALVSFARNLSTGQRPYYFELALNTNSEGFFHITDAPTGTFEMCISKVGFFDFCRENVQIIGGTFVLDPIALVETPPAGAIRIVVTWGAAPPDLDAHLSGPLFATTRFHVYYANRADGDATLDHDDTNSFGPETITITDPEDGMYRYSIHNFSDQSTSGGQGIAASPTRVQVYDQTGLLKSYTAPSGGSGNTWRVFEITVSGGDRTFNDNGGASLGYFTASGSGDTTVFLTGGGDGPDTKALTL